MYTTRTVCDTYFLFDMQALDNPLMQYQFVWIIPGLNGGQWWSTEGSEFENVCGVLQMQRFLFSQGVIVISPLPTNDTTNNLTSCTHNTAVSYL